MTTVTNTQENF